MRRRLTHADWDGAPGSSPTATAPPCAPADQPARARGGPSGRIPAGRPRAARLLVAAWAYGRATLRWAAAAVLARCYPPPGRIVWAPGPDVGDGVVGSEARVWIFGPGRPADAVGNAALTGTAPTRAALRAARRRREPPDERAR